MLRADLARDLAAWIALELRAERQRESAKGDALPARLDPGRRLLHVPALRETDKDLDFAEIEKRSRGRTACRHSLRHSTATLLGKLGAPAQVISAWMRHAGDTLADRTYTDRAALDVLSWLDRLVSSPDHERSRGGRRNSARNRDLEREKLVGESGLEPPTRSTQSYASTN